MPYPHVKSCYQITAFSPRYLGIYQKCFTNLSWLKQYGFATNTFNIGEYIKTSVLSHYPNVERIIILKNQQPLLFAHLCATNRSYLIVGGLVPELLNSGKGIICSLIVFDYTFNVKSAGRICIKVLKENHRSLRMVKKIGFKEPATAESKFSDTIELVLEKEDYPNHFSKKVLNRARYEKI